MSFLFEFTLEWGRRGSWKKLFTLCITGITKYYWKLLCLVLCLTGFFLGSVQSLRGGRRRASTTGYMTILVIFSCKGSFYFCLTLLQEFRLVYCEVTKLGYKANINAFTHLLYLAMATTPIKILILNCRGLNDKIKAESVSSTLVKLKANVIFLQETHLKKTQPFLKPPKFHINSKPRHVQVQRSGSTYLI